MGRRQYVNYENNKSKVANLTCGVPQGSVLGPLLFLIYINDLPKVLKYSKAIFFVDDTNIFASHKCIRTLYKNLNEEVATILHWFHCNKLSINTIKTHYTVITKKRTIPVLGVILNGSILQSETFVKFLGVYVDDKLTWYEHLRHCKSKLVSSLFAINMPSGVSVPNHFI